MRKVVLAMMTTLNGRLDDPAAWVSDVSDDLYTEIDRIYSTFDTILVGHVTYKEMFEYWPGAETETDGSEINKSMARKMNTYKKVVLSRENEKKTLEWNNAEQVLIHSDDELTHFIHNLKAQPGKDIHLSGGAHLAQSMIRLGLVDEYYFNTYPVVSMGEVWHGQLENQRTMELVSAITYQNGVVGLRYKSKTDD